MTVDPVCKMEVYEKTVNYKSEYHGKAYYFCAEMCKNVFEENPQKYIQQSPNRLFPGNRNGKIHGEVRI